jgi:hypothetical protein
LSDETPYRAADGGRLHPAASTLGEFLNLLEEGQFGADVYHDLKDLAADMHATAIQSGGKAKGEVTIKLKFSMEGAVFYISPTHSIKVEQPKRARSLMWTTEDNRFTPNKPHQGSLFGVRDMSGSSEVRQV